MNNGMVEACTGVIFSNPIDEIASSIHSANGVVKASQARGSFFAFSLLTAILSCSAEGLFGCAQFDLDLDLDLDLEKFPKFSYLIGLQRFFCWTIARL